MFPLLALIGCIERVTDVAVPLDPAFYEGGGGADAPSGATGALGVPWDGATGEKNELTFAISSAVEGTVQFDVVVPDAAAPGGVKRIGRVESQERTVTLSVPKAVTTFTIEVFQDPGSDGPSDDDPYATQAVDVAAVVAAAVPIPVVLVLGARPAPSEAGPAGGGGGAVEPWAGFAGETVLFTAELLTDAEGEIQVDVAEADPASPGGQKRVGQLRLPGSGAFTLDVPKSLSKFRIEAFQDREGDGPTSDDPYAELTTVVASITPDPVQLTLVAGSRGAAGSGGAGPGPGDPGPGGGGGEASTPWETYSGATVLFTGTLVAPGAGDVQLDVNEPDPTAPGGQKRVGQLRLLGSGPFSFKVPSSVTSFRIEAFQDPGHDGPSPTDPFAELTVTAATLGTSPTLTLAAGSRGQPTAPAPAPQPGGEVAAGESVLLSGTVDLPGLVKIDIFKPAPAAGKGRSHLKTAEAHAGVWEARVPPDVGAIEVEAYQDLKGDGPTPDDPKGYCDAVIVVRSEPVSGIALTRR